MFINNVYDIFAYEQCLNTGVVFQKGASQYLKSKFVGESIYVLPTPPPSMRRRGVRDDLHGSLIRRGAIAQQFGMNIYVLVLVVIQNITRIKIRQRT